MKKIIGVTPRILTEDNVLKQFVNSSYIESLLKYDCNVIMLTTNNPALNEVLNLCDGFLITGGGDMCPKYYGEENKGLSNEVCEEIDIIDKQVIEYAYKHKTPMLGICRGHQSINVILGGSLIQHIDNHTSIKDNHTVRTIKNKYLDFDEEILTNSYHHQAINKIAPDMTAIAYHHDGTIEAIIHDNLPIICLQWHPEKSPEKKESKIIFDKFFEFVNDYKK